MTTSLVPSRSPAAPFTPRVLIVHADAKTRSRYHRAFATAGCEVSEAGDGHGALMRALAWPPTLLLTDLNLPILNGPELCDILRHDQTTMDVSILVVTTETDQPELDRIKQSGADAVLVKPASVVDVLRESERLFANSRALVNRAQAVRDRIVQQFGRSAVLLAQSARYRAKAELPPAGATPRNHVLTSLPSGEYRRLAAHLTVVPMRAKQVLRRRDEPVRQIFFPNGGVCSIVGTTSNGATVECAMVGAEGVIGIEAFLDEDAVPFGETVVQVPGGNVMALGLKDFLLELDRSSAFNEAIRRYTGSFLGQIMQQSVCNALHTVQQRCARWLLATHDRMEQRDFYLSHEFLALMLGVRRPTVSQVAADLQRAGLIRYKYRRISILSRGALERIACECYQQLHSAAGGTSLIVNNPSRVGRT